MYCCFRHDALTTDSSDGSKTHASAAGQRRRFISGGPPAAGQRRRAIGSGPSAAGRRQWAIGGGPV
eukprot:11367644-Heterocapsa_arctica.AAC.1